MENVCEEKEQEELTLLRAEMLQSDKILVQLPPGQVAKYVWRNAIEAQGAVGQEGQQSEAAWKDIHSKLQTFGRSALFVCLQSRS